MFDLVAGGVADEVCSATSHEPAMAVGVPLFARRSIYGGSSEIQRNIIARRLLGLGDDR